LGLKRESLENTHGGKRGKKKLENKSKLIKTNVNATGGEKRV